MYIVPRMQNMVEKFNEWISGKFNTSHKSSVGHVTFTLFLKMRENVFFEQVVCLRRQAPTLDPCGHKNTNNVRTCFGVCSSFLCFVFNKRESISIFLCIYIYIYIHYLRSEEHT